MLDRTGQIPVIDLLKARERAENIGSTIYIRGPVEKGKMGGLPSTGIERVF